MTDECRTLCLGDVADIVMGQSPPGETVSAEPCGLPLLNGPTEFGQHHPSPVQFTTDVRKRAMRGDILFCVRGSTTGRMNWADQEYAIGRGLAAIRHKRVPELQPFVRAVVEYYLPDLLAQATGSTFPNVTVEQLARIPYPRLPEPEQRAIAHILGTLDDKIESNRRMSETLEAMARAIFKAWFVEFEPVRAKMEGRWHRGESLPGLPAHLYDLFPDRLADSELGEIPEGWEVMSFADTVEVIGGGTPKTSVPEYWNGDIPWFSVTDAPRDVDVWVVNTEKKITRAGVENSSTRILTEGITILSARGTVGRVALVGVPMAMNQSCYGLRGKTDERGFYTYFATRALVSDLKQRTHGSVFDTITRDTLKSVIVLSPPGDLVQAFERSVTPVLERIRRNLLANRTLAELRDALLPKVVSSEIRVKDAEWFLRDVEVVHDG